MKVTRFEDLRAWQRARELTSLVYSVSKNHPFERDFEMRDQIRKAALSVMSNIAEGFDRHRDPEFLYFLRVAKASRGEVRAQIYAAFDQTYVDAEDLETLLAKTAQASGAIRRLQESIERGSPGTRDPGPGTRECSSKT
jgi:four helix bundle protein